VLASADDGVVEAVKRAQAGRPGPRRPIKFVQGEPVIPEKGVRGVETKIGEQRALELEAQISLELAEERAWSRKEAAFGAIARVTSLFQRSRKEDFDLIYSELRYEPFWHVACKAHVAYERQTQYQVSVKGPEVKEVTIEGLDYPLEGGRLTTPTVEHCAEEARSEVYFDGVSGQQEPSLERYLKFPAAAIPDAELNTFAPEGAIVLGTSVSASAVVRQVLAGMSKQIQAGEVLDEGIEVQAVDLYYRPVYAFGIRWASKGRDGVIEVDGLTTEVSAGGKTYEGYTAEPLDPAALFDVRSDEVAQIIPGGRVFIAPALGPEPEPEALEPEEPSTPDDQTVDVAEEPE